MARRKRQYGSGCLIQKGKGWVIRWRELEITPDGTTKRVLRYERLGPMSRREASDTLGQKMAAASGKSAATRSRVTFHSLANEWPVTVLPMYKHSTQKHRRFLLGKHLLPRFGDKPICEIRRQEIQMYVAHLTPEGYAPKSIDHMPRCAERSTADRGEVGTSSGEQITPEALVFSTRTGRAISPNNVLRRAVFPACKALGIPNASWLTFRRTYASWSHDKGVPGKVVRS